jgi:hypothetical protein
MNCDVSPREALGALSASIGAVLFRCPKMFRGTGTQRFPAQLETQELLLAWICFTAALFFVCLGVHASTFLGIDPMAKWPGVMFLHLAAFLAFGVAAYYVRRDGTKDGLNRLFKSAPGWLKIIAVTCFAYTIVNGVMFGFLTGGGVPHKRDGKYFLESHGKVIREINQTEYHQYRAYVVRGFSSVWMLFGVGPLAVLVGARRLRRETVTPR